MTSRTHFHNDPILRKVVSDRVDLARQIEGREQTIAHLDAYLTGELKPGARHNLTQRKTSQETHLNADRVRLAQLDQTIAEMSQED